MEKASRGRVIVADPDAPRRTMKLAALREAGFDALGAIDGAECLAAAAQGTPLAAVIEDRLPDLAGAEVYRRLRESARNAGLAIVQTDAALSLGFRPWNAPGGEPEGVLGGAPAPAALVLVVRNAVRLRRNASFRDGFLPALGHELRSALSPLHMGLHLLKGAEAHNERGTRALLAMERQVADIVKRMDEVTDLARAEAGRLKLEPQRIFLADIVDRALADSRPLIERAGHRVEISLPPAPVPLVGDAARLAQALSQLLANSARYMREGGRIELVGRRRAEATLSVSVGDTGFGLDPAVLPSLFDAFAPSWEKRRGGGLGIGLPLARVLVELHGGTIAAESEGLDRGSRFTLTLPLATDP